MSESFLISFLSEVVSDLSNWYEDNYDFLRFGPQPAVLLKHSWRKWVKELLRTKGFIHTGTCSQEVLKAVRLIEPHLPRLEWLYTELADEESRDILIKVLAFRALGYRKVKLPLNLPGYWNARRQMEDLASQSDFVQVDFHNWKLFLMNLHSIGVPVQLYMIPEAAFDLFLLETYKCKKDRSSITADLGDYVIDAGGCWGDTAVYFAHCVGENGRVFTYEFVPSNLQILRRNLSLNSDLGARIQVVERAVWNSSNASLYYKDHGPGSKVSFEKMEQASGQTSTYSIDDLVSQEHLSRVDFIKMDIEGAEVVALHGAAETLRRFKPKLAISVYHRLNDFVDIPEFISSLDLGYRFYLRHATIHQEETVLFAESTMVAV